LSMLGPDGHDGLRNFWKHHADAEWLRHHPLMGEPGLVDMTIAGVFSGTMQPTANKTRWQCCHGTACIQKATVLTQGCSSPLCPTAGLTLKAQWMQFWRLFGGAGLSCSRACGLKGTTKACVGQALWLRGGGERVWHCNAVNPKPGNFWQPAGVLLSVRAVGIGNFRRKHITYVRMTRTDAVTSALQQRLLGHTFTRTLLTRLGGGTASLHMMNTWPLDRAVL